MVLPEDATQPDDGSRHALDVFMENRDENCREMLTLFWKTSQYWKGRVFLELLWSYEESQRKKDDTSGSN